MMRTLAWIPIIAALPLAAQGAVTAADSQGFILSLAQDSKLAPATAWQRFVGEIGQWWEPSHTYSGEIGRMTIDPVAGGCFCERLDGGGSVRHGVVLYAAPGAALRLSAPLGPLQEMPVVAILTVTFKPQGEGTRIEAVFRAHGGFTEDATKLAPVVDYVLDTQFKRFAASP